VVRPPDAGLVVAGQHQLAGRHELEEVLPNVEPRFALGPRTDRAVFQLKPTGPIGAMWLLFARAVAGGKRYRPCKVCQKLFEDKAGEDGLSARREFSRHRAR